ncbi:MAG: Fic family protein [Deltaproteobacteria bacterium]|nr:Fic family protein [Deltaproteobacteria bacterium]
MRTSGRFETTAVLGENVRAFVPFALPPTGPPLALSDELRERVRRAEQALRLLDLAGAMVPDVAWFVHAFVRKEAVVSSQIEGTQATLVDLLTYEAEQPDAVGPDVDEICNYLDAMSWARKQLSAKNGVPISLRMLNEAHKRLMRGVRGADKAPGELRRTQNWVGGTRPGNAAFVPPPPHLVGRLISDLEKYLHADDTLPLLVRAGLVHVQFETIHPYLDGNGRLGRLLVALLLEHWGLLEHPLLYLSLHFKRHRAEYYRLLTSVRERGDWEAWTEFFVDGVATIAEEAATTARELFALTNKDQARVLGAEGTSVSALRLFALLPKHPMVTIPGVARLLETTIPTANKAVKTLVGLRVLEETTGKKRDRTFAYAKYLARLRVGTDELL